MNTEELQKKVSDLINMLQVYAAQAEQIMKDREQLESFSLANTEREQRLNDLQTTLAQQKNEVESQKKYVDGQVSKNEQLLHSIEREKGLLTIAQADHDQLEEKSAYLEAKEKDLEEKKLEFEKEKIMILKQKEANIEHQKMLDMREQNIKSREQRLDTIERTTALR